MPYIAKQPGTAFRTFTDKDSFTGDGSTTTFDMQFAIAEAGQNDLQVFVGSTRQIPGTDYTLGVDGSSEYKRITFTSAPADSSTITVLNPGTVQGEFSSVADNAITSGKMNTDAITGQTELAEAANNADTVLIHDTSASALKKIQVSNLTAQAGDGLSKTSSTIAVDINGTTELSEGAASGDFVLVYDASAGVLRKMSQTNFLNFPTVSSVSPTNLSSGDGTGNHTIVITGSGFTAATASLVNASGSVISFDSQTVDSSTQITGTIAKSSLPGSGEPYDVRVAAASGLQSTLENQINIDQQPVFSTAAGNIGNIFDGSRTGVSFSVVAADPESGGDITYTLESGSLPSGLSLTSTSSGGVISGNAGAVGSNTTSTFTIRAKDVNSNISDREFNIVTYAPQVTSFTSSGTFTVPTGLTSVDVLVVAGGGGGGAGGGGYGAGGGGGAGGLIYRPGFPITPGTPISVTVGEGGGDTSGAPYNSNPVNGNQGQDSVFSTLTAKGGGGAGSGSSGLPGGSGGGAGGSGGSSFGGQETQPSQPGDSGNYGFGNSGGSSNNPKHGSGGGGSGGGGQPADSGSPEANGGAGKSYSISGSSVSYAGGGGGGAHDPSGSQSGNNSQAGGGVGGPAAPGPDVVSNQRAAANRGSGGGGGGENPRNSAGGGAGGKGIVIVSY